MKLGKFELDKIYLGDYLKLVKDLPDNCIDLMITDPPYGITFMGKDWDKVVMPVSYWKESLRVLKSGVFAFVMSSPRQDVLMRAINNLEKAGFNTGFTSIYWTYASGFPKAMNIGKMVDKRECKKQLTKKLGRKPTKEEFKKEWEKFREIVSKEIKTNSTFHTRNVGGKIKGKSEVLHTKGTSELEGSYAGFQPKPAVEVIIVAMKPLSEKTYIDQALKNKKGITWLDDCRMPYENEKPNIGGRANHGRGNGYGFKPLKENCIANQQGRFPANLLVSNDVLNNGKITKSEGGKTTRNTAFFGGHKGAVFKMQGYGDVGSYSRYFNLDKWAVSEGVKDTFPFLIVPKASKSEKDRGCENLPKEELKEEGALSNSPMYYRICTNCGKQEIDCKCGNYQLTKPVMRKNFHPTVKPIKLMSYLITLGSRKGDIILDPFVGSGTTAIACKILNRRYLGFEIDREYIKIANARLLAVEVKNE